MGIPTASFAPVQKSGVIGVLSVKQLIVVGVGAAPTVLSLMTGQLSSGLKAFIVWSLPLIIVGAASWGGRSLLDRITIAGLDLFRRLTGNHKVTYSVNKNSEGQLKLAVPGAVGERTYVFDMTPLGHSAQAAFTFDQQTRLATTVLRFDSEGWELAADEVKTGRVNAVSVLCEKIGAIAGVERIAQHCRAFPAPQFPNQIVRYGDQAAEWLAAEHEELVYDSELADAKTCDVLVTITVNTKKAFREIDAAGGGVEGVTVVLRDIVAQLALLLPACGFRKQNFDWCNADEIRAHLKLAFDIKSATTLQLNGWQLPAESSLVQDVEDYPTYLVTDNTFHRVYWIESFPRTPVKAGFLDHLVLDSPLPCTVTMIFEPQDSRNTEKRLNTAMMARTTTEAINNFLKRPNSSEHKSEGMELSKRESEIMEGQNDVNFQGYVTLHGNSVRDLDNAGNWVRSVTAGMNLIPLRGQQWPAFATAVLPLGLGARQ